MVKFGLFVLTKEFSSVDITDIGLNFSFVNVKLTSSNYFEHILGFLFVTELHVLWMVEFSHAAV